MPETTAPPPSRATQPSLELLDDLVYEVETVFHGKREVVRLALACVLARGHVLFEDVPGVGKTTLAHALAKTLGAGFRRIQFTADLLPSDVLGVSVYNPKTLEFETRRGPLFTNVVLADEINRAPPRTQSGLLEAMQEGSVTIDGETHELPKPFVVMATQNPLEHHGTYPLPESQLDRFLMHVVLTLPDPDTERRILDLVEAESVSGVTHPEPVPLAEVRDARKQAMAVHLSPALKDYIVRLVTATRVAPFKDEIEHAVSPRGTLALAAAAKARVRDAS